MDLTKPRRDEWLPLSHRRGRRAVLPISALALRPELPLEVRFYRVVERLRCRRCGAAPSGIEVRPRSR